MTAPRCTDAEFIRVWKQQGAPDRVAKLLGMSSRYASTRRRSIEQRHGISLDTQDTYNRPAYQSAPSCESRQNITVKNGTVLIGSDAHYWPGEPTVAHQAFVTACRAAKPSVVIMNGDIFDGARISRHDRFGWENLPSVIDELTAVKERMGEIERAAKGAKLLRTRGNHCLRFEKYLAMNAPEFREVVGFKLSDHLPAWKESWSVWINDDVVVKHRHHNGIHAVYNNILKGGKTEITGHLHSLKVTPWTDYNGTRYGVDTGTLSDPWGPQYEYMEDGARNWRSGFAVLTFRNGRLMPPELCEVVGKEAIFRGQPIV